MFEGTFTALVTPFTTSGELDRDALKALVERQVAAGITGLVPVGTTGESPTLTNDEHHEVIRLVVEQAAGRVPVIAGCGSNNTVEALEHTRVAKEVGAAASLHVAGYYNKPSPSGFLRHFQLLADRVESADRRLQHPRTHRQEHRQRDHAGARRAPQHRRRQGSQRGLQADDGPDSAPAGGVHGAVR